MVFGFEATGGFLQVSKEQVDMRSQRFVTSIFMDGLCQCVKVLMRLKKRCVYALPQRRYQT